MEGSFPNSSFALTRDVFENILHKTPFGFTLINADYVIEFANETWMEIVGLPQNEVIGEKIFAVFPEAAAQIMSVFEHDQPFTVPEFKLKIKKQGSVRQTYFNLTYQPTLNANGEIVHYSLILLDITDVVSSRNKVREDEERLRLATESSHTGTWDLNLKTREIVHSPFLAKVFGYEPGEVITHEQFRRHLFEYDRVNIVDKAFRKALQTGIYRYEAHIKDKNGLEKWIFTHGKIFFDEDGEPDRMLGVLQDISERKKGEIEKQQSHHQLNTAMEATKLGMFDMNPETLEKYNFSPRFLRIFGYDPETESIDTHVFEKHIHPDFIHVRAHALQKAKETGDLYYQSKIILRNGDVRWVELYGRLLPPTDGNPAYISGTMRDITDLKDYEEKISESEKKYRFLADAMPQIVWIGEPDGSLTYFNKSTFDYCGKNPQDFISSGGMWDIVHPDEKTENTRRWNKSVKSKKPFFFEHRFRNKANEYRWFMSRAFPELDELGNVTKWVGTSTDIDDMKRQEKQKDDFIKMANHELKTPVTTIKGYVQLLKKVRKDSDDKFLVNSLYTIENQVNKLNSLIGDLLDISRIESGNLPLNTRAISLVELVTETIEDIKASEHSRHIYLGLKHQGDIEVLADKDRLTQVLNNLLTNAIKYSPQASQVNVELYVEKGQATVSVEDFGIGMDKHELRKIFNRFYRVTGEDEGTFPGFGIGLYIVKDIMERHKGKIWVESEKNHGSKFYFSLPVHQDNAKI